MQEKEYPCIPGIEFQKYHWGYTATAAAAATTTVGAREGRTGGGKHTGATLGI